MDIYLSLLRNWRSNGSGGPTKTSSTTPPAASPPGSEEEESSFFDLDFISDKEDKETIISTSSSSSSSDDNLSPSPSKDSLFKSATCRFRLFALEIKKLKPTVDANGGGGALLSPKTGRSIGTNFFIEVFTGSRRTKATSGEEEEEDEDGDSSDDDHKQEDKKEAAVVQKYISKIKPLYIRVSRRYGGERPGGDQTKKKSKPAVSSPPVHQEEEEDGIQSAIAHCKRCFSRESEASIVQSNAIDKEVKK